MPSQLLLLPSLIWFAVPPGGLAIQALRLEPRECQALLHLQPQRFKQHHSHAVWWCFRAQARVGCARQQAVLPANLCGGQQPAAADCAQCLQGACRLAVGCQQKAARRRDARSNGE